jgi:glycine/D-amino acid oxidase-like deaminating enzyme
MKQFDVIIVGGGVLGASVFYHLIEARISCCLIEQNTIGSGITSFSGGIARVFHLDEKQRQKAAYSLNYFQHFEKHTGISVNFVEQGFLYFPAPETTTECKNAIGEYDYGFTTSWLTAEQVVAQFPFIANQGLRGAVWEPKAGYLDPVATTQAWVTAGQRLGGSVLPGCRVMEPLYKDSRLAGVKTNLGDIYGQRIVIAAGAASINLLNMLAIDLPIYTKTIQVDLYQAGGVNTQMPCFIDAEFNLNGRGGEHYLLQGMTCPDGSKHEDALSSHQALSQSTAKKRFNWSNTSEVTGCYCSLDTFSDRESGYADFVDEQKQVLLLSGFNGTAFKFAPYLGQHIQQLLSGDSGERLHEAN